MRNGSYRGKFERKNILFYKLDLNLSLIFMLTKSKNKVIQPKHSKGGSVLSFFLIIRPSRIIIGEILSWNWILHNLEINMKTKNYDLLLFLIPFSFLTHLAVYIIYSLYICEPSF